MLGDCNWVRNVRAAHGVAVLHRRRSRSVALTEVAVGQRAPILERYLEVVPGGRQHIPVDRREATTALQAVAARYTVFLVQRRSSATPEPSVAR